MSNIAICIPSYKNRTDVLLSHLQDFDKKFQIILFLSNEADYVESGYNKYDLTNVKIVYCTDCNTIFEKRQAMLDYVRKNDYDGYIQIDDDISFTCKKIIEGHKRSTSDSYQPYECDMNELLNKLVDSANKYNAGFASPAKPGFIGFGKPNEVSLNKSLTTGQLVYMNLRLIPNTVNYDITGTIYDDADILLQIIQNGVNAISLKDYCYTPISKYVGKNTLCIEWSKCYPLTRNLYMKYRDGITLRLKADGGVFMNIKYEKYFNTFELPIKNDNYHKELYNIVVNQTEEDVRNYIINNKKNK